MDARQMHRVDAHNPHQLQVLPAYASLVSPLKYNALWLCSALRLRNAHSEPELQSPDHISPSLWPAIRKACLLVQVRYARPHWGCNSRASLPWPWPASHVAHALTAVRAACVCALRAQTLSRGTSPHTPPSATHARRPPGTRLSRFGGSLGAGCRGTKRPGTAAAASTSLAAGACPEVQGPRACAGLWAGGLP